MNFPRDRAAWLAAVAALTLALLSTRAYGVGSGPARDQSGSPAQASPTVTPTVTPTATATATRTATEEAATATATAAEPTTEPSATPTAEEVAPQTCRVVAGGLEVSEVQGEVWAWSTVQNVSAHSVSLSAIQTAWEGAGRLAEVVLTGPTPSDVLFAGLVSSPASVGLRSARSGGELPLAAGDTARLGLRFEGASAQAFTIGPTVLHLRQGCAVALHQGAADVCGLETTDVRLSANDTHRIVLSVTNRSHKTADLFAVDVYWPNETNGRLSAIVLGGATRRTLDQAPTSPAVVMLEQVFGGPVTLDAGASLSFWLEFENPAAERPYVVRVMAADGCLVSSTTWLDAPGCGVKAGDFQTRGLRARLRLNNLLPAPQTPTTLDVFWPVGVNGALVGVTLDGQPVWRGRQISSPASIVLQDAPAIGPMESVLLEMSFSPMDRATPSPSQEGTISGDDYTVVLGLSGGCRLVYSTLRGPAAGCAVAAGSLLPREGVPQMEVSLTNTGGWARLRRALVSWPSRNGALTSVQLGAETLFSGSQDPGDTPFAVLPSAGTAVLDSQATLPLTLVFQDQAARSGYALALSFVDVDGAACTDMVITPPTVVGSCVLAIELLEQQAEGAADIHLRNNGEEQVELSFVNVEWPDADGQNGLVQVLLLDGDRQFLLWSGDKRTSPARIPLDGVRAAFLEPGQTVRLRLQYDRLDGVQDVSAALKLTVGTVEGCQASHPADDHGTRPERASWTGVVLGLPSEGLWGWWAIEAQWGVTRETRLVLVKSTTRLDPPTMRPAAGDAVRVEAIQYEDGWHAESIAVGGADQRVQLVGRISALDRSDAGLVRPGWIQLTSYDNRVWIGADTYVDGRLELGAQVSVVGVLDVSGNVTATTITVQSPPEGEAVTVRGTVQAARLAPELGGGFQLWTLDKYYVRADSGDPATRLEDPRGRLPRLGERLEVRGLQTGMVITATEVTELADRSVTQLEGTLVSLPAGGVLGTWTVRAASGEETAFGVESSAVVDTRSAPAVPGMWVRAALEDSGSGRWTALSVQTDWPPG